MSMFIDKVAIVTGAARGQGLAEATAFAEQGAAVALCDVLETEGHEAAETLVARGFQAVFLPLDVTSPSAWDRVVSEVMAWKGRIDILVNNAGILKRQIIATYGHDDFRQVLDVNLTGPFLGIQKVTPSMQAQGGGAIVNIASHAASSGHPDPAYTASKWGLRGLTTTAAMEFAGSKIRVNTVSPGLVLTDINRNAPHLKAMIDMMPLGCAAEVQDIVEAVMFLASDRARMITGEDMVIDGGFTAGGNYWKVSVDAGTYPRLQLETAPDA